MTFVRTTTFLFIACSTLDPNKSQNIFVSFGDKYLKFDRKTYLYYK